MEKTCDSLVLALSVLGIYMERDKLELSKLPVADRHARLLQALDRAVENCCIFPLVFGNKSEYAMGKLKLSHRPQWTNLHQDKSAVYVEMMRKFYSGPSKSAHETQSFRMGAWIQAAGKSTIITSNLLLIPEAR